MAQVVTMREGIAIRIKDLSARWAENTIALGREFKRARDSFPLESRGQSGGQSRQGWPEWVTRSTGWTVNHAGVLIRISEKLGLAVGKGQVNISFKVLEFLAREATPEEGVKEIVRRAKTGEPIGLDKAKAIVEPHREYPKPKEANQKAKETGKGILASDGNYYFGASKEQAAEYDRKIKIVYTVRRAIEDLAAVGMTAKQFLKYADKHQLWRADEEHLLTEAHDWLAALLEEWESR